jgi:hypothetical protein
VPFEIQHAGPKIHGPPELLREYRVCSIEANTEFERTVLKEFSAAIAGGIIGAPIGNRIRQEHAGSQ